MDKSIFVVEQSSRPLPSIPKYYVMASWIRPAHAFGAEILGEWVSYRTRVPNEQERQEIAAGHNVIEAEEEE